MTLLSDKFTAEAVIQRLTGKIIICDVLVFSRYNAEALVG